MSKKYFAVRDNIYFNGRIYDKGFDILVDDSVEMDCNWKTEKEYMAELEAQAKAVNGLTESEKDVKIKDLTAKLRAADKKIKELESKQVTSEDKKDAE
jgi:seryl-tRNA synthetase